MSTESSERDQGAQEHPGEGPPSEAPQTVDIGTPDMVGDGGLKDQVIEAMRTVFDPEIPVNVHALGLVYGIVLNDEGHCRVTMTLTSPNCPAAVTLPGEIETKVRAVPGVTGVDMNVVWDPPWSMEKMTEEARLILGF